MSRAERLSSGKNSIVPAAAHKPERPAPDQPVDFASRMRECVGEREREREREREKARVSSNVHER